MLFNWGGIFFRVGGDGSFYVGVVNQFSRAFNDNDIAAIGGVVQCQDDVGVVMQIAYLLIIWGG